jgi:2-oxoglutarate ferredoxin oxidoreductase subunit beta
MASEWRSQLMPPVKIVLKKLARDYDPTSRDRAVQTIADAAREKQFLTGLLYINEQRQSFTQIMDLVDTPLNQLPESTLRPGKEALKEIMQSLM